MKKLLFLCSILCITGLISLQSCQKTVESPQDVVQQASDDMFSQRQGDFRFIGEDEAEALPKITNDVIDHPKIQAGLLEFAKSIYGEDAAETIISEIAALSVDDVLNSEDYDTYAVHAYGYTMTYVVDVNKMINTGRDIVNPTGMFCICLQGNSADCFIDKHESGLFVCRKRAGCQSCLKLQLF